MPIEKVIITESIFRDMVTLRMDSAGPDGKYICTMKLSSWYKLCKRITGTDLVVEDVFPTLPKILPVLVKKVKDENRPIFDKTMLKISRLSSSPPRDRKKSQDSRRAIVTARRRSSVDRERTSIEDVGTSSLLDDWKGVRKMPIEYEGYRDIGTRPGTRRLRAKGDERRELWGGEASVDDTYSSYELDGDAWHIGEDGSVESVDDGNHTGNSSAGEDYSIAVSDLDSADEEGYQAVDILRYLPASFRYDNKGVPVLTAIPTKEKATRRSHRKSRDKTFITKSSSISTEGKSMSASLNEPSIEIRVDAVSLERPKTEGLGQESISSASRTGSRKMSNPPVHRGRLIRPRKPSLKSNVENDSPRSSQGPRAIAIPSAEADTTKSDGIGTPVLVVGSHVVLSVGSFRRKSFSELDAYARELREKHKASEGNVLEKESGRESAKRAAQRDTPAAKAEEQEKKSESTKDVLRIETTLPQETKQDEEESTRNQIQLDSALERLEIMEKNMASLQNPIAVEISSAPERPKHDAPTVAQLVLLIEPKRIIQVYLNDHILAHLHFNCIYFPASLGRTFATFESSS